MLWVFLGLQIIELLAVHFLLLLWVPVVAWVLFALTGLGIIWMILLIRSLYTQPVELAENSVRVRCGLLLDIRVAIDNIAERNFPLDRETSLETTTCNPAFLFMTTPNVVFRLHEPIIRKGIFGRQTDCKIVAIKLDEADRFNAELDRRMSD